MALVLRYNSRMIAFSSELIPEINSFASPLSCAAKAVNANWKMSFFAGMGCHFLAVSMRWVCSLDYPLLVGLKPVKS